MSRTSKEESGEKLKVRLASEADMDDVEDMVNDFVKGHPAENHTRSRSALREAFFGDAPVANLLVAVRAGRVIGMAQWTRIYDMFWSMYGGNVEWLYVGPNTAEVESLSRSSPRFVRRCAGQAASFCMGVEVMTSNACTNGLPLAGQRTNVTSRRRPSRCLRT